MVYRGWSRFVQKSTATAISEPGIFNFDPHQRLLALWYSIFCLVHDEKNKPIFKESSANSIWGRARLSFCTLVFRLFNLSTLTHLCMCCSVCCSVCWCCDPTRDTISTLYQLSRTCVCNLHLLTCFVGANFLFGFSRMMPSSWASVRQYRVHSYWQRDISRKWAICTHSSVQQIEQICEENKCKTWI